jgi:uncharacterized protein YdaU (DUF1376 family)
MAKDPAFLFYPNDWLGGTLGMTFEEKGAYIELLMMQFNRGHMTKHMIGQTVGQLWVNIEDKFQVDSKGLYFNKRLEIEKEKRKNFTESRRNNVSGKNQYSKKAKKEDQKSGHMSNHMEDVNENEIINKSEIKNELFEYFEYLKKDHGRSIGHMQIEQASRLLDSWYKSNNDKIQCLSRNILGNWKNLQFVEPGKMQEQPKQKVSDKDLWIQ